MKYLDAETREIKELALYDCISNVEVNLMCYEEYAGVHFDEDEGVYNNIVQIYDVLKWMLDNKEYIGFIYIKLEDIMELLNGLKKDEV